MIGESLLHYRVIEKVGQGGMGVVYRALDTRLGRSVALKLLPPDKGADPKRRLRFLREARAAASLNHPNIVNVFDIGCVDDVDFIAMEFVDGVTLFERMRRGRLPVSEGLAFGQQIAAALAKAHSAGVVHRDLKPGNVMINVDGDVKLLDFGLAQLNPVLTGALPGAQEPADPTASAITELGSAIGTLQYMSPEQARGEAVDLRSDIFSFGVMLYEMLAGVRPFQGASTVALIHAIVYTDPQPLDQACADLPPGLEDLLTKCMMKDRDLRFQTMEPVIAALRSIRGSPGDSSSVSRTQPEAIETVAFNVPRSMQRQRHYGLIAAAVALTLILFGVASPVGQRAWHEFRAGAVASSLHLPVETAEWLRRGHAYLNRFDQPGNTDRAVKAFQSALAQDPESPGAYAGLGEAYVEKHADTHDPQFLNYARSNAGRAIELNPLLAEAHVSLGQVDVEAGDYPAGEKELRRALELAPADADALLALGEDLQDQNRTNEAEAAYRTLIAKHPEDWRAYDWLGSLLIRNARYQEAIDTLKQAVKLVNDNTAVYRLMGVAYHLLDQDAQAAEVLQKALSIHATPGVFTNLGIIYLYSGRYEDAIGAFQGAIKHGANDYRNWDNLGDAYRFTPGNQSKAVEAYAQAIALVEEQLKTVPANNELRSRLALFLAKSGQRSRALTELAALQSGAKLDPVSEYDAGLANELLGRRSEALRCIGNALNAGYSLKEIRSNPDLIALRQDPSYHRLVLAKSRPPN